MRFLPKQFSAPLLLASDGQKAKAGDFAED